MSQNDERQVADLEERRRAAVAARDASALLALCDDRYVHCHASGVVQDRVQMVAHTMANPRMVEPRTPTIRVYGDIAIITGEMVNRAEREGGEFARTRLFVTQVARRVGDEWKFVSFQATRLPDLPAAKAPATVGKSPPKKNVYRGFGIGLDPAGYHHALFDLSSFPPERQAPMRRITDVAKEPFRGITTNGEAIPNLFSIRDEGLDTKAVKRSADGFLKALKPELRAIATESMDSYKRRLWANGFAPFAPHGILLEEAAEPVRQAAVGLLRATFSAKGFSDARLVMKLNALLGDLLGDNGRNLTEWMYWLTIFGEPSLEEPWGWQLMGHHLDLNVYIHRGQIVATPSFMGAEPRISDETDGPYAGMRVFDDEEGQGLAMMLALDSEQRKKAALYRSVLSRDLPTELAGRTNGRHRSGAAEDNLVLPYEGIPASEMNPEQRRRLLALIDLYVSRLPDGPSKAKMTEVEAHLGSTYFAWIGDLDVDGAPFYYKVHSPVILIEFDHHMGVFLDNNEPERFHAHTIVRTPNGGDYGIDLLRQHYEQFEHTPDGGHIPRRKA